MYLYKSDYSSLLSDSKLYFALISLLVYSYSISSFSSALGFQTGAVSSSLFLYTPPIHFKLLSF